MKNQILASMFILFGAVILAAQVYLFIVVPKIKMQFADQGEELSELMLLLIQVTDIIANYWYLTIFAAMIPVAIGISMLNSQSNQK